MSEPQMDRSLFLSIPLLCLVTLSIIRLMLKLAAERHNADFPALIVLV
jgi:hypothetical protein